MAYTNYRVCITHKWNTLIIVWFLLIHTFIILLFWVKKSKPFYKVYKPNLVYVVTSNQAVSKNMTQLT